MDMCFEKSSESFYAHEVTHSSCDNTMDSDLRMNNIVYAIHLLVHRLPLFFNYFI